MLFKIETECEEDGRWIADIRELPGVTVYGPTRRAAVRAVKALALKVLAGHLRRGSKQ